MKRIALILDDLDSALPDLLRSLCQGLLEQVVEQTTRIDAMMQKIKAQTSNTETAKRLQTMPGLGPITAIAIEAFAPPMETFKCGRDFSAWLGLVPKQHSSGGKQKLVRRPA